MIKLLCASLLWVVTLLVCGCAVGEQWFREDDLGQIINGLIYSPADVKRVAMADEREFIVPHNYKRSQANVLSGFLRPLKNVFFTVIHACCGLDVKAFYWHHVAWHATNVALFFWLMSYWVSLWLASLAGLLFAFYPDHGWLVWIAATHNSMSVTFLLAVFFSLRAHLLRPRISTSIFMGLFFLCSLLARENGVFVPLWITLGIAWYVYQYGARGWVWVRHVIRHVWSLWLASIIYVVWRCIAFGFGTLDRTIYNVMLRFPILQRWLSIQQQHSLAGQLVQTPKPTIVTSEVLHPWWHDYYDIMVRLKHKILAWSDILFHVEHHTLYEQTIILAVWLVLVVLCIIGYQRRWALCAWLIIGWYACSWQAFVAYPASRYINTAYPVMIALVIIALHNVFQQRRWRLLTGLTVVMLMGSVIQGAFKNVANLAGNAATMVAFQERYAAFFKKNQFQPGTSFIILGSPFVSDIESIFQYFSNDLSVRVAHELFATVAQHGYFGCRGDYHEVGYASTITPISGGYRFTSHAPEHMSWWMHFSDHPLRWVQQERAYRWAPAWYTLHEWHRCSVGWFCIHERLHDFYVTDISFKIDPILINPQTVIVSWDSLTGTYFCLACTHLQHASV